MPTVKINGSMQQVLSVLKQATQVLDGDGNLLGVFTPSTADEVKLYALACKLFDPAELDRRLREEGGQGIPYSEVKKRLQSMETQG